MLLLSMQIQGLSIEDGGLAGQDQEAAGRAGREGGGERLGAGHQNEVELDGVHARQRL